MTLACYSLLLGLDARLLDDALPLCHVRAHARRKRISRHRHGIIEAFVEFLLERAIAEHRLDVAVELVHDRLRRSTWREQRIPGLDLPARQPDLGGARQV